MIEKEILDKEYSSEPHCLPGSYRSVSCAPHVIVAFLSFDFTVM